jgi:hypothetical protein
MQRTVKTLPLILIFKKANMKRKTYFKTVSGGKEITFRESLGQLLFVGVLYIIGYSFFFVAIFNLLFVRPLPLITLLASLIWIAFIVALFVSGCRRTGARQHLANILGNFILNRFAIFTSDDSGDSILAFGYKLGSKRNYFLKLRAKGITSVDWGPGQGNIPGGDNDWNIAMWFNKSSVIFDGTRDGVGRILDDEGGIYIVGPSGNKASREAFGNGFIEFLQTNGVRLVLPQRELLGQEAEVVKSFPFGRIKIGANEYEAKSIEGIIDTGSKVVIAEIIGTSIYVRQTERPDKALEG